MLRVTKMNNDEWGDSVIFDDDEWYKVIEYTKNYERFLIMGLPNEEILNNGSSHCVEDIVHFENGQTK